MNKIIISSSPGVYTITNMVNGKLYVGGSGNMRVRLNKHKSDLRNNKHPNKHLQSAWNLYGEDNFKFEELEQTTEDLCFYLEQYWKNMLNSCDPSYGYDINPVAFQAYKHKWTEEEKKIISLRQSGRKLTEKHKKNIGLGNLGKTISEETKRKQSESIKKAYENPELRKMISNKLMGNKNAFGYKPSEETKKKISEKAKSRVWTDEKRDQSRQNGKVTSRPVNQYNLQGELLSSFVSIKEASRETGFPISSISGVLYKINKTSHGFIWKFKDEI